VIAIVVITAVACALSKKARDAAVAVVVVIAGYTWLASRRVAAVVAPTARQQNRLAVTNSNANSNGTRRAASKGTTTTKATETETPVRQHNTASTSLTPVRRSVVTRASPASPEWSKAPGRWQPDADVCACPDCAESFTMTRRRHHCRACLQIFCNSCAPRRQRRDGAAPRACGDCYAQGAIPIPVRHS
jgi:hypothetical protein